MACSQGICGYLSGRIPADHLCLAKIDPVYGKMHIYFKSFYISDSYVFFDRSGVRHHRTA
jgi:hypothetical protein